MRMRVCLAVLASLIALGPTAGFGQTGLVTLDHVDGLVAGKIAVGFPVTFNFRYTNDIGSKVSLVANGYRVYSPDGAGWSPIAGAYVYDWGSLFTSYNIYYYSADGLGADSLAFLGYDIFGTLPGLPTGFSEIMGSITTTVTDLAYDGLHLCLDSTYVGIGGVWAWGAGTETVYPAWDGVHCYEIISSQETCLATGDVNGSGSANASDVVDMVNFLYNGAQPLDRPWEGDLTGDCILDTLDIVRLVCRIFQGCSTDPMPTCCDPTPHFPGDKSAPIGGAVVTEDDDGLIIGEIGMTGKDGVRLYPDESGYSGGFRADMENVLLDGSGDGIGLKFYGYIESSTKNGAAAGTVLKPVGMAGVTNVNGQIQVTADFNPVGDPEVEFRVWIAGVNVRSGVATVEGGGVIAQGTGASGDASVTGVAMLANNPPVFVIQFDRLVQFTLATSPEVQLTGNEIHLVAVNAVGSIVGLGQADVTGEYIGWFGLTRMMSDVCCLGFVGNANMDPTDGVTISDISTMIDNLFISGMPLPCLEEADVNLSGTLENPPLDPADITISDISVLIDYLFITQAPTRHCP